MHYLSFILSLTVFLSFSACSNNANSNAGTAKLTEPIAVNSSPSENAPQQPVEIRSVSEAPITAEAAPEIVETAPKSVEVKEKIVEKAKKAVEKMVEAAPDPTPNKKEVLAKEKTIQAETKVEKPKVVAEAPKKEKETKPAPPPAPKTLSHAAWDALLRKHVSASGKVNYKGLKADKAALETYLQELAEHPIQESWSRGQKMAYWINAYNAFTVKLIVDNYPVSSITKLHNGKPWDAKWIKLGGKTYSLNNIENDILRPKYKEARIHFAVNCAAQSCPPLLNRAWTAANLNSNFEKQAKAFINNTKYNQISTQKVSLSKIFDWYGEDFGNLIAFLNKYAGVKIDSEAKVEFMEYNWGLNE